MAGEIGYWVLSDANAVSGSIANQTIVAQTTQASSRNIGLYRFDGTNFAGIGQATYGSRGLRGANNAATPNTKYDIISDVLQLRNKATNEAFIAYNVATLTCDVTTGPTLGGRDMSAAIANNSWIYLYALTDNSTYGLVASSAAPTTGPNSVANGHVGWAYIAALRFNASSQIPTTRLTGNMIDYLGQTNVLSGGAAITETVVSLSAVVPPDALRWYAMAQNGLSQVADNNGSDLFIRMVSSLNYIQVRSPFTTSLNFSTYNLTFDAPNVNQQFIYHWSNAPDTGINVDIKAYKIANGGE